MKVQDNPGGMNVNGRHQLLVNSDDDNLVGKNMNAMNKHTETLLLTSGQVGLGINVGKTKHLFLYHKNARPNHNMKTASTSFVNLIEFEYLGMTFNKSKLCA
jgi:hypothetical protein